MHWHLVLALAFDLKLTYSARNFNDPLDISEDDHLAADRSWGDRFRGASDILWKLDLAWFLAASLLALIIAWWRPASIVGDSSAEGDDSPGRKPTTWFSLGYSFFLSLTSHAAGIVGFVGFQKIVVARIVSASQPKTFWTLPDFLLYTSIAISITAIISSFVFLSVDYLRRLAIASCRNKGLRLVLKGATLEQTGLGKALMLLTAALLLLYLAVLYTEAVRKDVVDNQELLQERVLSCATVLLYYFNLRSLCESPKVQFHTTCDSMEKEDDMTNIRLTDFLTRESCDLEHEGLKKSLANVLEFLAGEDLSLFLKHGRCDVFFTKQRFAPLVHVIILLLVVGALPAICQATSERLFNDPEFVDVKALSATLAPGFQPASRPDTYLLLLDAEPAQLQVKPEFQHTSSISICCEAVCVKRTLQHSLIKFDDEPVMLKIPVNSSSNCTLTAAGLSSQAVAELHLTVEAKAQHNLCGCSESGCKCCDGYTGGFKASSGQVLQVNRTCRPAPCDIQNSNNMSGPACDCADGYIGNVSWDTSTFRGVCRPAPCGIAHSNGRPGPSCGCENGFIGNLSWSGPIVRGVCVPSPCDIAFSNRVPGRGCACQNGRIGNISWEGPVSHGECSPAPCKVPNSNHLPGSSCQCQDGFLGDILWSGPIAKGVCQPAPCEVPNSNRRSGNQCKCKDGYTGEIVFQDRSFQGTCQPAPCDIANSNMALGLTCECATGFMGNITWEGPVAAGQCEPAPCKIENSTKEPGLACSCDAGYHGIIFWNGSEARGRCAPAPCNVPHTNAQAGRLCQCLDGFEGTISWNGSTAFGRCEPARCDLPHSVLAGRDCRCDNGFAGNITWKGSNASGSCKPAECSVTNSNRLPGSSCKCLDGYDGHYYWDGSTAFGHCLPMSCEGSRSNKKAGPECACEDGFAGTRKITQGNWQHDFLNIFVVACSPAPCDVPNSNRLPGRQCSCSDGFAGDITWNGSSPKGSCQPASCRVANSNMEPGLACRCQDAFAGNVTWNRSTAVGVCEPMPCRVPHSDQAAGPACRCAEGFFGSIAWNGPLASGTCRPLPACSENIVYATHLTAPLEDAEGNKCEAGQPMLVRGGRCHEHSSIGDPIYWTLAEAIPPKKCRLNIDALWQDCGEPPAPEYLTLPGVCVRQPAPPRCSEDIRYLVTAQNISRHGCTAVAGGIEHKADLAEFRGRQCGYDLISWEATKVPSTWSAGFRCSNFPSLGCGQALHRDSGVPIHCQATGEPAVLSWDFEGDELYMKMFDNGKFTDAYRDPLQPEERMPSKLKRRWWTNGTHLFMQWEFGALGHDLKAFRLTQDGGLSFNGPHGSLVAPWPLPSWWTFKFQASEAVLGSYSAERLSGCKLAFSWHDTCYIIVLGENITELSSTSTYCHTSAPLATWEGYDWKYEYAYTVYGIQTYRSDERGTCSGMAAYHEIQLEVVDVHVAQDLYNYTVTTAPCRTAVRYAVNVRAMQAQCGSGTVDSN